jgi:predicted nucleic acid-binding protein
VLIARTAKRAGAVVVTADVGDFRKIRRFCDVQTVDPNIFF